MAIIVGFLFRNSSFFIGKGNGFLVFIDSKSWQLIYFNDLDIIDLLLNFIAIGAIEFLVKLFFYW